MDVSKVLLVALILVICAVIFQLIGLASPYWVTADTATTKTNSGLWRTCTEGVQTGLTTCVDTKDIFLDNGTGLLYKPFKLVTFKNTHRKFIIKEVFTESLSRFSTFRI